MYTNSPDNHELSYSGEQDRIKNPAQNSYGVNDQLLWDDLLDHVDPSLHQAYVTGHLAMNDRVDVEFSQTVMAEFSRTAREAEARHGAALLKLLSSNGGDRQLLNELAEQAAQARYDESEAIRQRIGVSWRLWSRGLPEKISSSDNPSRCKAEFERIARTGLVSVAHGREVYYQPIFLGTIHRDTVPIRPMTPKRLLVLQAQGADSRVFPEAYDYHLVHYDNNVGLYSSPHKPDTTVVRQISSSGMASTIDTSWFRSSTGLDTYRLDLRPNAYNGIYSGYDGFGTAIDIGWLIVDKEFELVNRRSRLANVERCV